MHTREESAHAGALPFLLAASVLASAAATGRTAPPLLWALWAVLAAVMVWGARRKTTASLGGGHRHRAAAAVRQLDSEVSELRLRAVRELAAIADEWPAGRQVCIDALCTYLRRPSMGTWGEHRVRRAALVLIAEHLRPEARNSWRGCDLNLAGASIADCSFAGAEFAGCVIDFSGAHFEGASVMFSGARFVDATVAFTRARFDAGVVDFAGSEFSGGSVDFSHARQPAGKLDLSYCLLSRGRFTFDGAWLRGSVDLFAARLERSHVSFAGAQVGQHAIRCDGVLVKGGILQLPSP